MSQITESVNGRSLVQRWNARRISTFRAADDVEFCLAEMGERIELVLSLLEIAEECVKGGDRSRAAATLRAVWDMADGALAFVEKAKDLVE